MTRCRLGRAGSARLRDAFAASLLYLLTAGPRAAQARTTIVPDQFPTIQAAVDAVANLAGNDTLLVRGGDYPERVLINDDLVVLGIPPHSGPDRPPSIDALEAGQGGGGNHYEFTGVRFEGDVVIGRTNGPDIYVFRECQFDGGLRSWEMVNYPDAWQVRLVRCRWTAPVQLHFQMAVLDSCVAFAPVSFYSENSSVVRDCQFDVGSGTAVTMIHGEGVFERNVVRGGGSGLVFRFLNQGNVRVVGNRFEGLSGTAIDVYGYVSSERTYIEGNRISDCGGHGIVVDGLCTVRSNVVVRCGGTGIQLTQVEDPGTVESNVVGHCGTGIVIEDGGAGSTFWSVRQNTVYGCAGAGITIRNEGSSAITNNLVVTNLGPGLLEIANAHSTIACNDWYGNGAGGTPPSATDFGVDPLFCDLAADDVRLRSDSPVLDAPGCGRIGVLGSGCEPVRSLGLRIASPIVRSGGALLVRFTLPVAAAARLELMDLAGRRLRSRDIGPLGPGEHSVDLAEGERLPSGVYFVRILQGDQSARARAVFIR